MNKKKLYSLMPIELIMEDDVNRKIEEQREIINAGNTFVSELSINQYLYTKLEDFNDEEVLNLFSELSRHLYYNEMTFFSDLDIGTFACVLEEFFNLDNEHMYELDNLYIVNLLRGKDITKKVLTLWEDKTLSFEDILVDFVFHPGGICGGETSNLMQMLIAKKTLLGSYLAEKNIERLRSGQKRIFDLSILM